MKYRIGNSIDIHPLTIGAPLYMGGIKIPYEKGSLSHSDGDALSHAISEAILGALGLGDLGQSFSDKDDKYKGISSLYFLHYCRDKLKEMGYVISNIDTMIVLEDFYLKDYKNKIKESIASALDIDVEKVNIKAGTNEKIGTIGNGEAYLTWATVLIEKEAV